MLRSFPYKSPTLECINTSHFVTVTQQCSVLAHGFKHKMSIKMSVMGNSPQLDQDCSISFGFLLCTLLRNKVLGKHEVSCHILLWSCRNASAPSSVWFLTCIITVLLLEYCLHYILFLIPKCFIFLICVIFFISSTSIN